MLPHMREGREREAYTLLYSLAAERRSQPCGLTLKHFALQEKNTEFSSFYRLHTSHPHKEQTGICEKLQASASPCFLAMKPEKEKKIKRTRRQGISHPLKRKNKEKRKAKIINNILKKKRK